MARGAPVDNQHALKFDERRKKIYFDTLAATGRVFESCDAAGVSYDTIQVHRRQDPTFKEREAEAKERFVEKLEQAAQVRAVDGVDRYVVSKGKVVYHKGQPLIEKHYSDTLLVTALKAAKPEKYRENIKVDGEVKGGVLVVPAGVSVDEWLKQAEQVAADQAAAAEADRKEQTKAK